MATCCAGAEPLRAVEGDIVTLHWRCINEDGAVLESTRASDEPTTFEVGAGDIVGNRVFEAFDEAVRGLSVGESATIKVGCAPRRVPTSTPAMRKTSAWWVLLSFHPPIPLLARLCCRRRVGRGSRS